VVSAWLHGLQPSKEFASMPFHTEIGPPPAAPGCRLPIVGPLASLYHELTTARRHVHRLSDAIIRFGKETRAEAVWFILQGQTPIRLALPVAEGLGVPLYTLVWDPPGWWLRGNNMNRISRAEVMHRFGQTLNRSEVVAVASDAMAEVYSQRYGANSIPMLPFLPDHCGIAPKPLPERDHYAIGLAGQIYASREFDALMKALDSLDWRIMGKPVIVVYLGANRIDHWHPRARIVRVGWTPESECLRLLSQMDLLYCPYWFDPEFREEASLSFPSKLVSYLAAGRPVLFHGPEYASPVPLFRRCAIGSACHTLAPDGVAWELRSLLGDCERALEMGRFASQVFRNQFSFSARRPAIAKFFDLDAGSVRVAA
jgi:glycosyltransferase involved in cell wall biosynthesis